MKNDALRQRLITNIVVITLIAVLSAVMIGQTRKSAKDNANQYMNTMADERAIMINEYVADAENTLAMYSNASEIRGLLEYLSEHDDIELDKIVPDPNAEPAQDNENANDKKEQDDANTSNEPDNNDENANAEQGQDNANAEPDENAENPEPEQDNPVKEDSNEEFLKLQKIAQEYTDRFSSDVYNLEGIYVSTWKTKVLAHTHPESTIGMITRKDEARCKELQDAMLAAGTGVYDTGIIISPAPPFRQIVSMYKAIYDDNGEPIGLVGLGIFTEGLINSLDNLSKQGFENAVYSMVNTADYKYIFVDDESLVAEETGDRKIRELCDEYKNIKVNDTGSFEFKKDGKKYLSTYSYMAEKGWLLMIDNPSSEVFAFARSMTVYLSIFCVVTLAIIVLFNIISKKQEETSKKLVRSIEKHKKAKENLSNAVMHDILTSTDTRVSFFTEYEKGNVPDSPEKPYYFIMTNIKHFSEINIEHGNDAGDMVLVKTAEALKNIFSDCHTYRTGSDEFITVEQSASKDLVMSEVNKLLAELNQPNVIGNQTFKAHYAVAVVKKSTHISTSVTLSLKNILNNNNDPMIFVDLDEMGYTTSAL